MDLTSLGEVHNVAYRRQSDVKLKRRVLDHNGHDVVNMDRDVSNALVLACELVHVLERVLPLE